MGDAAMESVLKQCRDTRNLPSDLSAANSLAGIYKLSFENEKVDKNPFKAEGDKTVHEYLIKSPSFTSQAASRLHSVQLFTDSHDEKPDNGVPENGLWTWFELALLASKDAKSADRQPSPRRQDGVELTWLSHVNLDPNIQAGKKFDYDSTLLRSLKEGDMISMRLCARFDGWKLFTESAYLIFKFGDPITRSANPQFGQIVSHTKVLHEAFTELNAALLPGDTNIDPLSDTIFQASMLESRKPLKVLALDGGGVRGVASLIMLDAIMQKIAPDKKPCEVFDMIAGTSTGGLIAVMLGRFRMSIEDVMKKYRNFMSLIFPLEGKFHRMWNWETEGGQYDAGELEKLIKRVTAEQLPKEGEDALLVPSDWREHPERCKVVMLATKSVGFNNSAPAIFRSYARPNELSEYPQIKIWEAGRATSAAPTYFAPLTITDPPATFMDGGLQANNPIGWLWNEVLDVYGPAQPVSLFLSLGTGIPQDAKASNTVMSTVATIASVATNSEISNILFRSLLNAFSPVSMARKYWRLNVGDGMPDWVPTESGKGGQWVMLSSRTNEDPGSLDDVAAIDQTIERANDYIKSDAGQKLINEMVSSLQSATA